MIALFTDFGIEGPYIGQVQAELANRSPGNTVINLFPDLPAYNVRAAACLLPAYAQHLPANTVCLCVVDPGVGTERGVLVLRADGRWYTGPDNGLFSMLLKRAGRAEIWQIDWRPGRLSASFHGRDLFAPLAAEIANTGQVTGRPVSLRDIECPDWPDDVFEVVYIDRYGNAMTGVRASQLSHRDVLVTANRRLAFARTFAECAPGSCFWYENANGLVEIAASQASASRLLGLQVGTPLQRLQDT